MINFRRHRFSKSIIITAVRWYLKYKLSLSDVSELLVERNVNVSRESIRKWVGKFGPQIAKALNAKRRKTGKHWYVDETYIKISGTWCYVYHAVDENMEPLDVYVSKHRNKKAAKEFFIKCIKNVGVIPESIQTDLHNGYDQVKSLFPKTKHHKVRSFNNKAESSHVPIKQRYRPMRGFKNLTSVRIFLESFQSLYRFFREFRPKNHEMRNLYKLRLLEFGISVS